MTGFQWIVYIIGIISFIIGCFFYYISKNENHNNKKKLLKWIMNIFLIIALVCLGISWF